MDRMDRMTKMTNAAAALLAIGPEMNGGTAARDATVRESHSPFFISGRWRERPRRRPSHLGHPVNPVHPVSCRSRTGGDAYSAR